MRTHTILEARNTVEASRGYQASIPFYLGCNLLLSPKHFALWGVIRPSASTGYNLTASRGRHVDPPLGGAISMPLEDDMLIRLYRTQSQCLWRAPILIALHQNTYLPRPSSGARPKHTLAARDTAVASREHTVRKEAPLEGEASCPTKLNALWRVAYVPASRAFNTYRVEILIALHWNKTETRTSSG